MTTLINKADDERYVIDLDASDNQDPLKRLDPLTGLLNRPEFVNQLRALSAASIANKSEHAFFYIDLDLFKVVNDVHGHAAGDELICSVTKIIKDKLRQNDFLARMGGDEFGLVIQHCDREKARQIADLIRQAIRTHKSNFTSDLYTVSISASIGIVMINSETENISDLLKKAFLSCYAAKSSGRDRVQIYQDDNEQIASQHDDMLWFDKINKALDADQFCFYIQPIIPLAASELMSAPLACEVLLRMKDESGNIIMPDKFFPPAVRYGLASRLDRWVINAVMKCLDNSMDFVIQYSMITINLSGQSLGDQEFLNFLISKLETLNFPTTRLCFEITETEAIANMDAAIQFITKVKTNFGCLFALDDFGSGFASFKYVKQLPVDIVKIDGTFVKDMLKDPASKILIKALNDIAQISNKKTIAEWVESKAVLDELQALGVNYAQGYFLGEPAPAHEFMK